jgi:hypothetical protein
MVSRFKDVQWKWSLKELGEARGSSHRVRNWFLRKLFFVYICILKSYFFFLWGVFGGCGGNRRMEQTGEEEICFLDGENKNNK